MDTEAVGLYFGIIDVLRRIGGQVERLVQPFCNRYHITPLQLSIVVVLYMEGPKTVSGLSKRMCVANANNSALCKRMEKEELVMRQRGSDDERQVLISLAPKGEEIAMEFAVMCKQNPPSGLSTLKKQDMESIMAGLELLATAIETNKEENEL